MGLPLPPKFLASVLGFLWPALPLILGLSLGCSLSLLQMSWIHGDDDTCLGKPQNFQGPQAGRAKPQMNEMKPQIIPYSRPPRAPNQKVLRSRYIQAELGFRERLSVLVLSSRPTLNTLAVAVNRTLAAHVNHVMFFTGSRGPKLPQGMKVVCHGDERPAWLMYLTLRYIEAHLISAYDWFYVTQDDAYTNGYHLQDMTSHLNPGPPHYIGRPLEFIGGQDEWRYCHGGSGYLLSRTLVLSLAPHLEFCVSDILGSRPDEWLGRCIQDTLGVRCVGEYQGFRYVSLNLLRDVDDVDEALLSKAFSVHPVREATLMYRLQRKVSQIVLRRIYRRIQKLQNEIQNLSSLTPKPEVGVSWPAGINPPYKPTSHYDVLPWEYFTETHSFSCPDGTPKCPLQGMWLRDVQQVLEETVEYLNRRHNPWLHFRLQRLLNGYRRFDPTRGMEYTLDLLLEATTESGQVGSVSKRVTLLRPLSLVELLPMPYVTEAARVQLVLPLIAADAGHVSGFLDAFATNLLDPQENVALTALLVHDMGSAGQDGDIFEEVRRMMAELERRYSHLKVELVRVGTKMPSQIQLIDVVSKKHPAETLFFLVDPRSEVTVDALNRCRMNSICSWQVFSPVHYREYSPDVLRHGFPAQLPPGHLRDGRFDRFSSSEFCFCNSDFTAARGRMASEEVGEDGATELLELFLQYSELHVFRALEPALVQRFSVQTCSSHLSGDGYHRCVLSNLEALGSRIQLAMALYEQDEVNNT